MTSKVQPQPPLIDVDYFRYLFSVSPHCTALGYYPNPDRPGVVSLVIPAASLLSLPGAADRVHPAAIGDAVDAVCSIGAMCCRPEPGRIATIDLRWDLHREVPMGDVVMTATYGLWGEGTIHTTAELVERATGEVFGTAHTVHSFAPGKDHGPEDPVHPPLPAQSGTDFNSWLGLSSSAAGPVTQPWRLELTGTYGLPYFHGGALTGIMAAVAIDRVRLEAPNARMATATASFDIFADDQPLQIEVQAMKRTRTRASIYLTCSQGERGVTSRLAAHFVIPK